MDELKRVIGIKQVAIEDGRFAVAFVMSDGSSRLIWWPLQDFEGPTTIEAAGALAPIGSSKLQ